MAHSFCRDCIYFLHWSKSKSYCEAFPEGIPVTISIGLERHEDILQNQIGDYIFSPIESKKEFYKKVGFSFEGFENPIRKKILEKRQKELGYKLRNPPVVKEIKEDINTIKKNIQLKPKIELILELNLKEEITQIEPIIKEKKYSVNPISLVKEGQDYFLVRGLADFKVCKQYGFDFSIELLEFESEIALFEWIVIPYYTNPDTSEYIIGFLRFLNRNRGWQFISE